MNAARPDRRILIAVVALVLGVYVLGALWFAQTRSIWSPDCGARLVQIQSILQHPPQWWITYPGAGLDPQHENSPLSFYEHNHDGKTYVFYSFLYALLNAPLFQAFGYFGLAILSIVGGVGSVLATHALAVRLRLRMPLVPAIAMGLATPLALYSVVFWDHALLTALGTVVVVLALRGAATNRGAYWLAAGAVLGAGLWLHEILAPYVPALLLGAWWLRSRHSWAKHSGLFLAGVLLFAVPLLLLNSQVYGTPLGPHMANNRLGTANSIGKLLLDPGEWAPGALYTLIGWGNTNPAFTWQLKQWLAKPWPVFQQEITASLWMGLPLLGWLVLGVTGWWRRWWPLTLLALGGLVANSVWVLRHDDWPHSPFLACPLLLLGFCAPIRRERSEEDPSSGFDRQAAQAVVLICLFYTVVNLLKPTLGGTEWGSRHLLSVYPCLVVLGWAALEPLLPQGTAGERSPGAGWLLGVAGAMAALSVLILGHGMFVVRGMHQNNRALADAVALLPDDVVVCSSWWAPMNGAPSYYDKKLVFADQTHPAPALFERMAAQGVRSYSLLGFSAWDLSRFSAPSGYMPVYGTDRKLPLGLATGRYTRVDEMPPAAPAASPTAPGTGDDLPPPVDIRPGAAGNR